MKIEEWQNGNDSELTALQRLELHNIWLKKNQEELKQTIFNKKIIKEPEQTIKGFVDID